MALLYDAGTIAYGTTGVKTITCGFQPVMVRITVAQKTSTSQTFEHRSVGTGWLLDSDPAQYYAATFQDTTGGKTVSGIDKIVSHWERVSGTLTEKVAATFDSFTATAAKINVTTADANYDLFVEIFG